MYHELGVYKLNPLINNDINTTWLMEHKCVLTSNFNFTKSYKYENSNFRLNI